MVTNIILSLLAIFIKGVMSIEECIKILELVQPPSNLALSNIFCDTFLQNNLVNKIIFKTLQALTTCFRSVDLFNISEDCTDCMEYKSCPAAVNLVLNKTVEAEQRFREAICDFGLINGMKSLQVCCSMLEEHTSNVQKFNLLPDRCGEIRGNLLLNGPTVELFEFEWLAVFNTSNGHGHCTGSIITPRYILTAASCVKDRNITSVRLGEFDLSTDIDCVEEAGTYCTSGHTDMIVEKVIPHEGFKGRRLGHDIALIRLEASINLTKERDALCLPKFQAQRDTNWFNTRAVTVGWGAPKTVPLKSYLRVLNDTTCNDFYERHPDIKNYTFCAKDMYDNTNLDAGSPFFMPSMYGHIRSHVQYGILTQAVREQHLIYTNVTKYMDWILKTLHDD